MVIDSHSSHYSESKTIVYRSYIFFIGFKLIYYQKENIEKLKLDISRDYTFYFLMYK